MISFTDLLMKNTDKMIDRIALIKFDIGERAIDLITSEVLPIFQCQILIKLENLNEKTLLKIIKQMENAMFQLKAKNIIYNNNSKINVFYLTFCSKNCDSPNFFCK